MRLNCQACWVLLVYEQLSSLLASCVRTRWDCESIGMLCCLKSREDPGSENHAFRLETLHDNAGILLKTWLSVFHRFPLYAYACLLILGGSHNFADLLCRA